MWSFHWVLLGMAFLIAFSHGALINIAANDAYMEQTDEVDRLKRSYKRGQTQSQYLNFGQQELDGKAEAEATDSGSRSTVSGTHGMGQAQSQFSSGDCTGCGVGSSVYEYSTGSPDPLTLGGNIHSYADGKPSSIIGLQGTSPGGTLGPSSSFVPSSPGHVGRPGAIGTLIPGTSGVPGQFRIGGGFTPGTVVAGAPGVLNSLTPSTGASGQTGSPSARETFAPGVLYSPGSAGQVGRTSSPRTYAPGGPYTPGSISIGQAGRPASNGAPIPGISYVPGTGIPGNTRTSASDGGFIPGSIYAPGAGVAGQVGRPGPAGIYDNSGQVGRPSSAAVYAPGTAYDQGAVNTDQIGKPGFAVAPSIQIGSPSSGIYSPSNAYAPQRTGLGQISTPEAIRTYAPGNSGTAQIGVPGPSFGYVPPPARESSEQQGTTDYGKSDIGRRGQQGLQKPEPPQLIAPPAALPGYVQGPQTSTAFGPQVPAYRNPGQQSLIYTPGDSYNVPGASYTEPGTGKQQEPAQYTPADQQIPTYVTSGRHPEGISQIGEQPILYGHPGQHVSPQNVVQPGSFHRSSSGYAPGQQQLVPHSASQQIAGFSNIPRYTPSYRGPSASGSSVLPGGTQYPDSGPQQTLLQPAPGTITSSGGIHQNVGGSTQQPRDQRGSSIQSGLGGVQQSGVELAQPGAVIQQGHLPTSSVFTAENFQPGNDHSTPAFGGAQPGTFAVQPPVSVRQPSTGFVQPGAIIQPGTAYGQPIGGIQQGTSYGQPGNAIQQGVGISHDQQPLYNQPTTGIRYQPSTGTFIPQSKPGTTVQKIHGYVPAYGPQEQSGIGSSYPQGTKYGQPNIGAMQGGTQPGFHQPIQSGFGGQPIAGVRQSIDGQSGTNHQGGAQPGIAFSQYPGAGFSQPSTNYVPVPTGDVQHGAKVEQGSGFGTGAIQHVQPGSGQSDTGIRLSGSGFSQMGQGPQQIVQPGTTYIPGGIQPSDLHQPTGSSVNSDGSDDAFSQAESSIGNGQAAASAQGKKNGGTAKTQVQGTYTSSGSFSASAMTSDNDRSASSQVTGGIEGAMSQSQGQGGAAQSQAQVQVNEKTGGTKASSQSGGVIHQSQSEVQANDKGGLADAQSSGPGQTSSQAQIGFRPGQDGEIVRSTGGGQASAISGAHSGNSQSQIQGTSKYGISYHGAAQSASGTKEQVATYREQNRNLFNTISQFGGTDAVTDRVDTVYNPALTSESDIPDLQLKASRTNTEVTNSNKVDDDSILTDEEEEEPYDEYEEEDDYYNENPIKMESKANGNKNLESSLYQTHTQTSPSQTQQIAVANSNQKYNVVQNQNGRVETYPASTTTEAVPNGFRGTVNVEKKFHTKSLKQHKFENKLNVTADQKPEHKPRTPDSFVTVTKSITGSMDNSKNPPQDNKNFQSTYYTKSSTCGYFTFSCNIVYGANGRSKICRPKAPTNGKC